ncbi:MAG: hypothetical protein P4M13_11370 [Alphaproteobacteria bacterium]|nr:hypothetical protein [Alphaproteobacteria bacterium]
MNTPKKFPPSAGIAIGPILFIIALLAVLAAVMAAGNGDFQVAGNADRITDDIAAQANLIRNTINQCNLQYSLAVSTGSVAPTSDPYPATPASGLVASLLCDPTGGAPLWNSGTSNILMPQPTNGFNPWSYIDSGTTGGRCIWTTPTSSDPKGSSSIVSGLTRAAAKFNASTAATANSEVIYNPASDSQKFVVWITMPASPASADSHCLP